MLVQKIDNQLFTGQQGEVCPKTSREGQTLFRCSVGFVRVAEGDGWVSGLPWASNKSLTPITLGCLPFLPSNKASRVRFAPRPAGRVRPNSGVV